MFLPIKKSDGVWCYDDGCKGKSGLNSKSMNDSSKVLIDKVEDGVGCQNM